MKDVVIIDVPVRETLITQKSDLYGKGKVLISEPEINIVSDEELMNALANRVDFVGNVIYRGEANAGTLNDSASWRIRKITVDGDSDVTTEFADGSAEYKFVWNDRVTYNYK
ncbi:MAG: hypothetical protein K2Y28_01280 [Burkholderiaceae bacterium]|nr:hypothetical protein [Burkholderiaceae bacterium]